MMAFISDRRRSRTTVLLIALGSTILSARADMIVTDGMQPWEIGAEYHGLDGISVMARFPKLAGQLFGYIAKQVRVIRDGRRHIRVAAGHQFAGDNGRRFAPVHRQRRHVALVEPLVLVVAADDGEIDLGIAQRERQLVQR